MKRATPAFWAHVRQLAASLDERSYYELLEVDPGAADDAIGVAYRRLVRLLHPDRHAGERDEDNRAALVRVFARVGEAFRVLGDPPLRRRYDEGLARGERRLEEDEGPRGPAPVARDPNHPQARSLYERALALANGGDRKGARAQLELARQFEPNSAAIAAKLAELAPPGANLPPPAANLPPPLPPPPTPSREAAGSTAPPATEVAIAPAPAQPAIRTPEATPRSAAPRHTPTPAAAGSNHGSSSGLAAPEDAALAAPTTRRHRRLPVDKPIVLRCRDWDQVVTLYAKNLSRSGMFVRTDAPLAVGTAVALTLIAPSGDQLRLGAEVVRVVPRRDGAPAGMGLRFAELGGDARRQFEHLLAAAEAAKASGAGAGKRPAAAPTEIAADQPPTARPLWPEPIAGSEPALSAARRGVEAVKIGDLQRACRELGDAVRALPERADLRARFHLAAAQLAAHRGFDDQATAHFRKALDFDPLCQEALQALRNGPDRT